MSTDTRGHSWIDQNDYRFEKYSYSNCCSISNIYMNWDLSFRIILIK